LGEAYSVIHLMIRLGFYSRWHIDTNGDEIGAVKLMHGNKRETANFSFKMDECNSMILVLF